MVATVATIIATPIGVLGAFGLWKSKSRYKAALDAFFALPIVVPGLVTGISLLIVLTAADEFAGNVKLICGHVLIVLPYVIRTTLASLSQFNPSLWEAAETLGASPPRFCGRSCCRSSGPASSPAWFSASSSPSMT